MAEYAYLVLADGTVFKGRAFGARAEAIGEVVFTTGMTGYIETLTDPSFHGQIVVQTFPLIGNYGIIPEDFESARPHPSAYIVKKWCQYPSNFRSEGDIDTFLKDNNIVGLSDIDTRRLTKIIRETGVMNGAITSDPDSVDMDKLRAYNPGRCVPLVSSGEIKEYKIDNPKHKVVLFDFGAKDNIRRCLNERGCDVISVPYNTTAEQIKAINPDGIMLSNGPGDPSVNMDIVEEVKKLFELKIPTFGICLGHQLLALAAGGKTAKLKYGHRGANHPVKDMRTGRVYITSQNHGYYVVNDSLPDNVADISHINANDGTCEGVSYKNVPCFSVQFHPEAAAGPQDTAYLFDIFMEMMEGNKNAAE